MIWLPFAMLVLCACESLPARLWPQAPGWSRAQLIGVTRVQDPIPMALEPSGRIYLFSFVTPDDSTYPHITALDRQANPVWEQTYREIPLRGARHPKLVWDGTQLQLFWTVQGDLHHATASRHGDLLDHHVFDLDLQVNTIDVAVNSQGLVSVWLAGPRENPGLYALDLNLEDLTLIDPLGVRPSLQYDAEGTLHAAWAQWLAGENDVPIRYGAFPGGRYSPGTEATVVVPRFSGTTSLFGPMLGLDRKQAYIFWSTTTISGLEAGKVEAKFVHFPAGEPSIGTEDNILRVPSGYTLDYQEVESTLESGPRVELITAPELAGTAITEISPNSAPADELVVAVLARLSYPMRKTRPQISAVYFHEGIADAYQELSFTPTSSSSPTILSDAQGRLYVNWLERADAGGWGVYFSSTASDLREALSGLDSADVARLTTETMFGLASGALLLPISLAWAVPALIVLVLTARLRRFEDDLEGTGAFLGLALALLVLWVIKLAILPSIQSYIPFSAWIPIIPPWLDIPLRIGVPIFIVVISAFVAWRYLVSKRDGSPYKFIVIYAVVDGVLTMAIYGLFIYGVA